MSEQPKYIAEVFGQGGFLAKQFPGYKPREGQLQLTQAIDTGMSSGTHVLAEAPCGSGKGLAYLVPAIYHATKGGYRMRTVVATETIALQEQLVEKDLPTLQRALPWSFTYALIKGRNNYLCLAKLDEGEALASLKMFTDDIAQQAKQIVKWAAETEKGDVSELPFVPAPAVWSRFSVSSDECTGDRCVYRNRCHAERAKEAASTADIIVTNFHMLFAHLSVRRDTKQDLVLPPFDQVILDESHAAPGVARSFFGVSVSEFTVGNIAREANKVPQLRVHVENLKILNGNFFDTLRRVKHGADYNVRLRPGKPAEGAIPYENLVAHLRMLGTIASRVDEDSLPDRDKEAVGYVERRAPFVADLIEECITLSDPTKIYWIEEDQKSRCKLTGMPLDVSKLLEENLFAHWPTMMVSATLATNGNFDFIRREAGVPRENTIELIAESPFNFRRQALLVVPDMVEPNSPSFPAEAARIVERVIELCEGRTLGLFTSYRNLNAVHERIRHLPYRILKQGDQPRTELVRQFKLDVNSVLLGTSSLWTGVDVSGEALTGLIIDKLPFPPPDDPLVDAISERDKDAFGKYLIPQSIITLRQGVGRLIRSVDDVGVVVILDSRLATKSYGKRFLNSLPHMRSTRDVEQVARFLEEAKDDEL